MQKYGIFSDLFSGKFEAHKRATLQDAASELYKPKTFIDSFRAYYSYSRAIGLIAQVFSGLLAFSFFYAVGMANFSDEYLASGFSVICCGAIELLKAILLKEALKKAVIGQLLIAPILGSLIILFISGYTSVNGADSYSREVGQVKLDSISVASSSNLQAIKKDYESQLKEAKTDLKAFRGSISWRGKIDASNKKNMSIIASKQERISRLEERYSKELDKLEATTGEKTATTQELTDRTAWRMICIAIANETIIVLCIGFCLWFLAGVYKEEHIGENSNENSRDENSSIAMTKNDSLRICEHCNKEYVYNHKKQRFCCNECRIASWGKKNGQPLIFKSENGIIK